VAEREGKVRQRPIVLGIVGDSAAGKTTLARGLGNILGEERVTHVFADDYHRYDREERARLGITALDPECNYIDILELHLERLHYGQPILKPVYDHSNGTLIRPLYLQPREFVILEGLLGFHTPVLRQFYDVRVFLDPPENLRKYWKVRRDTEKRGYSEAQVLHELRRREQDSLSFVRPQREHADIVVTFYPAEGASLKEVGPHLNVRLVLRPTIPHPDLSYLFDGSPEPASGIRLDLGRDEGRPVDILEIDGSVTAEDVVRLEEVIWDHLPGLRRIPGDQFGLYQEGEHMRQSPPLALTQLLLTFHLLREQTGLAQLRFARPVAALSRLHFPEVAQEIESRRTNGPTTPAPE
jgi:phosphoribulokinase